MICPDGFPYFETNTISVHGDVCRNEIWHGFGVGWTCPIGCVGANSAPWCMQSSSDNSPCRAGKLLSATMRNGSSGLDFGLLDDSKNGLHNPIDVITADQL